MSRVSAITAISLFAYGILGATCMADDANNGVNAAARKSLKGIDKIRVVLEFGENLDKVKIPIAKHEIRARVEFPLRLARLSIVETDADAVLRVKVEVFQLGEDDSAVFVYGLKSTVDQQAILFRGTLPAAGTNVTILGADVQSVRAVTWEKIEFGPSSRELLNASIAQRVSDHMSLFTNDWLAANPN